VKDILLKINE
jgi:Ca2+-binding EF-hand superfamily protein